MIWLYCLLTALVVGYVTWHWGRAAAPRDSHALRVLLGQERDTHPGTREDVAALEDALVRAGWRHVDHITDPVHHDEAGRYMFWGD